MKWVNLTGSNVVVHCDGLPVTLPAGVVEWTPSAAVAITNGVDYTAAPTFSVFRTVVLQGEGGTVSAVQDLDHFGEFKLGFGLVVTAALIVAAIRKTSWFLNAGNNSTDL